MNNSQSKGLALTVIESGRVSAILDQSLTMTLRLEGACVTLEMEHQTANQLRDSRYQARFPIHLLHGEACVGKALIDSYEAPLLTGSYLPFIEALDEAFTQVFQVFLRLHRQQLIRIAKGNREPADRSPDLVAQSAGVWVLA